METEEKKEQEVSEIETVSEEKKADSFRISKKTAGAILFVIVLIALAYVGKSAVFAVMVNGSPITRLEVMMGLESASGKAYVETLITEKLIAGEARAKGIVVSPEDIAGEIARIETGLAAQGATMEMLLTAQGLTMENLKKQLMLKQTLEKLLAEKVAVTDAEIDAYIAESKLVVEEAKRAEARTNIMEQLRGQKLNKEASAYIEGLRISARVVYFGDYISVAAPAAPLPN